MKEYYSPEAAKKRLADEVKQVSHPVVIPKPRPINSPMCETQLPHITILGTQRCDACGETFRRCPVHTDDVTQELAEVVRNGVHLLIHQTCMEEGEEIA